MAIALSMAAMPAQARASGAPQQLTLSQAIASALSSAGMAPPPSGAVPAAAFPALGLTTAVSVSPEEGRRGAVTESEELTIDLRPRATRAAVDASRARFAQSVASVLESRRALIANVISAFFTVAKDQADAAAARETLDLARRSLDAASRRHKAGVAPAVDVERATIAVDQTQADLDGTLAALEADRGALALLTDGGANQTEVAVPQASAPLLTSTALARDVLATDPAVAAARASFNASQAQALLARAELEPALTLGAGVGRSIVRDSQVIGPAANVSLGIPFAGGASRANVIAADAACAAAQAHLRQTQAGAVQSALRALTAAAREQARIGALQDAYARARRVAEAELKGYAIGAVASVDVINAQAQAAAARMTLAQARTSAAQANASLELSIGAFDR
ncbi:MAG TPA: TolC family protein [Candidatus Baltobacteraceae bacterium]|nr:TolC family protein [Candidatus Baltobacteraceae bacterium]